MLLFLGKTSSTYRNGDSDFGDAEKGASEKRGCRDFGAGDAKIFYSFCSLSKIL